MTRTGLSNSCITLLGMNNAADALYGNAPIFGDSCSNAVSGSQSWPGLPRFSSFLFLQPCASMSLLQFWASQSEGLEHWDVQGWCGR